MCDPEILDEKFQKLTAFKSRAILSSMIRSHVVLLRAAWEGIHLFVQHIHTEQAPRPSVT